MLSHWQEKKQGNGETIATTLLYKIAESFSVSFPLIWCFYAKKCFHYAVVLFKENLNAFLEIERVDIELLLYFDEECIGQVFEKGIVKRQQWSA